MSHKVRLASDRNSHGHQDSTRIFRESCLVHVMPNVKVPRSQKGRSGVAEMYSARERRGKLAR
eukprot:6175996-Pleurochrysis_carterae.AAC.1